MQNPARTGRLAKLALFAATLIWGTSFIVMKNTVDVLPPNTLLGLRFTFGCLLLCGVFYKRLKNIDKDYLRRGAIIGLCLFCAYFFQTVGLTRTTPGKNAFLTAVYCVLVPFLFWMIDKTRPDKYNFAAAFICIIGIGLVSLDSSLTLGFGDAFTLIGGVFYAAHMTAVAKLTKDRDPVLLTILQFGFCALFAWITAAFSEQMPASVPVSAWLGLGYLAVFATGIAMLLQNVGQKYTDPSAAAILLSLESVFGVLFSILFYGERLSLKLVLGFALIFVAVITSETKLAFLRKPKVTNEVQHQQKAA